MYNKWPRIPWTYPTEDEMNHEHDIEQWRWATGGGLERRYWREGWK
ncbi:MAG: hypothetical protein GY851_09300 [bacterium]|nr:hypothetical protein [bacterium]